MKTFNAENNLSLKTITTDCLGSIIKKTLFFSTLCLGFPAPAAWGQVPFVPPYLVNSVHVSYPNEPYTRNLTNPYNMTALGGEGEDEFFGYNLNDWSSYNHDPLGTRYNTVERKLSPKTVPQLKVKWTFTTEGNVNATPIVVEHKVYAGDTSGNFYALSETGQLLWKTKVDAGITASALATPKLLIFGDQQGFIYGLERHTCSGSQT